MTRLAVISVTNDVFMSPYSLSMHCHSCNGVSCSMSQHVPSSVAHTLRRPGVWLLHCTVFCMPCCSGAVLVPWLLQPLRVCCSLRQLAVLLYSPASNGELCRQVIVVVCCAHLVLLVQACRGACLVQWPTGSAACMQCAAPDAYGVIDVLLHSIFLGWSVACVARWLCAMGVGLNLVWCAGVAV
jgi:hypothetical protein